MGETFADELRSLINRHSRENSSDTPDWILAAYIEQALLAFESATRKRDLWYGRSPIFHEIKENK